MARSTEERRHDARVLLDDAVDAWVATASAGGRVHLVPLSVAFVDGRLVAGTPAASATARNAAQNPHARVAVGGLRDVVMLEVAATVTPWREAAASLRDGFVQRRGWDPGGEDAAFVLLELVPARLQVWRDVEEIAEREVLGDGAWLAGAPG